MIWQYFNKSIIFRLIFFSIIFFNPTLEANNYFLKTNKVKENSKIYVADNQITKIETVTATGVGTSLEKASQNAATNALTQVVGSFIDSETNLQEQTKIKNGIFEQTSIIKENINDYSQGSIKYFEILDVQENNSIYKVTARIDVKIEDFRAYIKKLASSSTSISEIDTASIIAEVRTKEKNLKNKLQIFGNKIINPIREGTVYEIKTDKFYRLKEFQENSKECLNSQKKFSLCDPSTEWLKKWETDKTFIMPVKISLKEDFKQNMLTILNNISTYRIDTYNIKKSYEEYLRKTDYENDFVITFLDKKNRKKSIFILKDLLNEMAKYIKNPKETSMYNPRKTVEFESYYFNPLVIQLLDKEMNSLFAKEFKAHGNTYKKPIVLIEPNKNEIKLEADYMYYGDEGAHYLPEYSLFASSSYWMPYNYNHAGDLYGGLKYQSNGVVDRIIFSERSYLLVAELDLETLSNLRQIKIEYLQK